jgi:hypothetical protein
MHRTLAPHSTRIGPSGAGLRLGGRPTIGAATLTALVVVLAGMLLPQLVGGTGGSGAGARTVPAGLAQAIHARFGAGPIGLGRAPLESGILPQGTGWEAKAAAQSLAAQIRPDGAVTVRLPGRAGATLTPQSVSSGTQRAALGASGVLLRAGRLSTRMGVVGASDQVTMGGLEQSFTIGHRLSSASALALSFSSSTRWRVIRGGSAVVPAAGAYGELTYAGLRTTDARGRLLRSRFVAVAGGVRIVVVTAGASFPITIDPTWTTTSTPTATLTNGMSAPGDSLGYSVAFSQDGKTALVGALDADNDVGTAYVFHVAAEGSWATSAAPVATLYSSASRTSDEFGYSVALSADGTTAVVGAIGVNGSAGAAYVFHASSEASWVTTSAPVATLSNSSGSSLDRFGSSVALSSDGQTVLIGADGTGNGTGTAYLFRATSETSWSSSSTPAAHLTSSGSVGFGGSVALASDGTTALIGASGSNAAYLYHVTSAASWVSASAPTATLSASGSGDFGDAVSLSSDGTTALVGAEDYGTGALGKAFVFHVSAESGWTSSSTPSATLSDSANPSEDNFGSSVSLSADGTTALVGARRVGGYVGAAYIFHVSAETAWANSSAPSATLTNSAGAGGDDMGLAVALSSDGTTALAGSPGVSSSTGAGYEFHATTEAGWSSSSNPAILTNVPNQLQEMGESVSLSADGTTALVGAVGSYSVPGAAYVFHVSSEGSWSSSPTPVATLTAPSPAARDDFGGAVALSGDGTTAVIGAIGINSFAGAAYVFHVASESSWASSATPAATLTDGADGSYAEYGSAVAASADGTTVLVSDSALGNYTGAAYVYHVASAGSWSSSSTPPVTLAFGAQGDRFGVSVALSADGTTALIGAWGANGERGAAYVFHASTAASWVSGSAPAATLSNGSAAAGDELGISTALSSDGTTALVGALGVSSQTGAAYVFHASSSGSWGSSSTPNATLTTSSGDPQDEFGAAVALSGDGRTALIGAPRYDTWTGAAYAYQASAEGAWSTTSTPVATLTDSADSNYASVAASLALPSDGLTGMVGAWGADASTGAAYVYSGGPPPAAQPPQVTTGAASGVSSTSATLNATVNPEGSATTYAYDYGTTTSLGSTAPASGTLDAGSGDSAQAQPGEPVSGLTPSTTYYVRVCANSTATGAGSANQVCGGTVSFTTSSVTATGGGGTGGAGTSGSGGSTGGASAGGSTGGASPASGATQPPSISGLTITPRRLSLTGRRAHGSCKPLSRSNRHGQSCRQPLELQAGFTLSREATITLTITGELSGRSVHGHCVAATTANHKDRPCVRTVAEGHLSRSASAGADRLTIAHGSLPAGTYKLTFAPAADGESGQSESVSITITG